MNKKRSEWANEEGSALVLTLMIFLVLTVLATSISFLTVGSFRLSDINRDGTSAFYIAEAGAKKAYEEASQEVMKTYEATTTTTSSDFYAALDAALDALFLNKELTFDKQFGDDAKANVTFTATDSNPRKYTLTSTGSVGGKTRTVQKQFDVSWVDKGGSGGLPALPSEKTVLMTQGETTFRGSAKLEGDIHT
ncbi:MAG: pilus assembly PilX N-terminal domain-containing protein, partial [Enterococcus aquimarinus]